MVFLLCLPKSTALEYLFLSSKSLCFEDSTLRWSDSFQTGFRVNRLEEDETLDGALRDEVSCTLSLKFHFDPRSPTDGHSIRTHSQRVVGESEDSIDFRSASVGDTASGSK